MSCVFRPRQKLVALSKRLFSYVEVLYFAQAVWKTIVPLCFISLGKDELTEAHFLGEGGRLKSARWWENKFGSTERLKFGGELKKKNPPESFCLTAPVKHGRNMFPRWISEGFLFSPLWPSASVAVLSISGLPKGGVHEHKLLYTNCGRTI